MRQSRSGSRIRNGLLCGILGVEMIWGGCTQNMNVQAAENGDQPNRAAYSKGYQLDGFTLQSVGRIEAVDARELDFTHDKTGAKVIFLLNDDPEKTFTTIFQTAPTDNTGKLHVLEHAESAASAKYPGRDVFFAADSGCYLTFLNATTFDNATNYLAASLDEDQLETMADFYMDCAFHSAILTEPNYFKSEAWRYELSDAGAPLTRTGVVYNEMKGVYGDIDSAAYADMKKTLFPDTAMQYDAGGRPQDIVKLQYSDLISFYQQCYQPSNSTTLMYGDVNVDRFLKLFDSYFKDYDNTGTASGSKQTQQPFAKYREADFDFPADGEAEDTGSEIIYAAAVPESLGFVNESALQMAVAVLADPSSILMQALNKSGIGTDYSVESDYIGPQLVCTFTAENADASRKEEFRKIIMDSVQQAASQGLSRSLLQNVYTTDQMTEKLTRNAADVGINMGNALTYAVNCNRPELLDPGIYYTLAYQQAQNGLCEQLLQSQILDNTLACLITENPKKGLQEAAAKAEEKELAQIKASMTPQEISSLVKETAEFAAWNDQGVPESTMKKLQVVDAKTVQAQVPQYRENGRIQDGVTILTADAGKEDVAKCRYLINLSALSEEEMQKLSLYCGLSGRATTLHSQDEMSELTGRNLYDGSVSVQPYRIGDTAAPWLEISYYAADGKAQAAAQTALETAFLTDMTDTDNLSQLGMDIENAVSDLKDAENLYNVGGTAVYADSDDTCRLYDELNGVRWYRFLDSYAAIFRKDPAAAAAEMAEIRDKIMHSENAVILVAGNGADTENVSQIMLEQLQAVTGGNEGSVAENAAGSLAGTTEKKIAADQKIENSAGNFAQTIGFQVNSDSSYVVCGYNAAGTGTTRDNAVMKVAAGILGDQYMVPAFRYGEGAYGAYAGSTITGKISESLYRAPSAETFLQSLKTLPDVLADTTLTADQMNSYKLSAISDAVAPAGNLNDAMQQMIYGMRGITVPLQQEYVSDLRQVTDSDVRGAADRLRNAISKSTVWVIGPASELSGSRTDFDQVIDVR